jgi:hypothetical protein
MPLPGHGPLSYNLAPPRLFAMVRTDSTFNEIPVMCVVATSCRYRLFKQGTGSDLKGAVGTDFATRRALADLVRDACVNVGFFYGNCRRRPSRVFGVA